MCDFVFFLEIVLIFPLTKRQFDFSIHAEKIILMKELHFGHLVAVTQADTTFILLVKRNVISPPNTDISSI